MPDPLMFSFSPFDALFRGVDLRAEGTVLALVLFALLTTAFVTAVRNRGAQDA